MIFQDKIIDDKLSLIGYSYFIKKYKLKCYLRQISCISEKKISKSIILNNGIYIFDKRYLTSHKDINHLIFALKHENFDLLILKQIILIISKREVKEYIIENPTGIYARKIFYLYEHFNNDKININDIPKCKTIDLLDSNKYITTKGSYSKRHKVNENLLGNLDFSPVIRKTKKIENYLSQDFNKKLSYIIGGSDKRLIERAVNFLTLADSRSSFEIEGENNSNDINRWSKIIMQAGKNILSINELERLQNLIIKDNRFIEKGIRSDGVFLGERDSYNEPIPEFIGAKPTDIKQLLLQLIVLNKELEENNINAVINAAIIAFAFIYIHPFADGNGRIHRYLLHHILAHRKFYHKGLLFPISTFMLDNIDQYRAVLQNHTKPLMDYIDWKVDVNKNVEVLNETVDLYKYFDCTESCEFIIECIELTIQNELPKEIEYLKSFDIAENKIKEFIEMPNNTIKQLIIFIYQNNYILSNKRRKKQFANLSNNEVEKIESIIKYSFTSRHFSI